jgi:hypothetical protein
MVTLGGEFDIRRILVFMIRINVLHIYDLLSVSGKLVADPARASPQATALPVAVS